MSDIASRDQNDVPTLLGVSNVDGTSPVKIYADPTTHRLLVNATAGLTELTATGTVDGVNVAFTFTQQPTYIVADGAWYKQTDNNGATQWSWSSPTATMTIPPASAIFGIA